MMFLLARNQLCQVILHSKIVCTLEYNPDSRISIMNGSRSEEGEGISRHPSINVQGQEDKRIQFLERKLSESPKALSESAGRSECCIFRVHPGFTKVDVRLYQPRIVSIGPYHHGKPHLKTIQEHKWRFLARVIKRTTEAKGVGLKQYIEAVKGLEAEARLSYSEDITLKDNEFVEMLVLDGCFVVEMFRAFTGVIPFEKDDPFGSMQWIRFSLRDDFLCLENQIPFQVLEKLFTLTKMDGEKIPVLFLGENPDSNLSLIALHFFNTSGAFARKPEVLEAFLGDGLKGQHLLDILRRSYFPPGSGGQRKSGPEPGCFRRKHRKLKADLNIHCISGGRSFGRVVGHILQLPLVHPVSLSCPYSPNFHRRPDLLHHLSLLSSKTSKIGLNPLVSIWRIKDKDSYLCVAWSDFFNLWTCLTIHG
ncbi:unnamed protein product [Cuscuta epithymum]|uniref:Uncharacterized protein n=1 Tax=Cuscuta epithymum TaxID=186058 RepID=A0AAV0EIH5_9ASTE|nr:unnamed protein product [Cuscuta epithymum]